MASAPPHQPLRRIRDVIARAGKAALLRIRQAEARNKQARYVGCYVAVTGSCGKTTTTALAGALLSRYGTVVTSHRNVGTTMLRTVRKLKAPVDYVVQETGGHAPGAIDVTAGAYDINVAVVTSVGFDHASKFRSPDVDVQDAIAREKGKLVEAVSSGGFACLNFDDARVRAMAARTSQKVVGFGQSEDADVRARNVVARWPGRLQFELVVGDQVHSVRTRFVGTLMLTNVLGALAVVHGLGLDLRTAVEALEQIEPVSDRMGVHAGRDGKTYILDTEKAPLWSTELLVRDLQRTAIDRLVFVLGDMSDIRSNSSNQYRKLVRILSPQVDTVVLAGMAAEYAAKVANEGFANLVVAPTAFDVSRYLDTRPPGTVVLLKSNKSLQLWRVLDQVTPVGEVADA